MMKRLLKSDYNHGLKNESKNGSVIYAPQIKVHEEINKRVQLGSNPRPTDCTCSLSFYNVSLLTALREIMSNFAQIRTHFHHQIV